MKTFDTLTEALDDLRKSGYALDFNLKESLLNCPQLSRDFTPDQFHVDYIYRFEGESDPSDSTILYGISTTDGAKGTMVDAYGAYATETDEAMLKKLSIDRFTKY